MSDGLPLAGRGRRLLATLIDAVLVPALTILLVMITDVVEDAEDYVDNWWILRIFALAVLSYLILNGYTLMRRGQTLGKLIMGIGIVSVDASGRTSPTALWKLICVRALFFPVLFLPIFSVFVTPWLALAPVIDQLPIFTKRRRCLHDLVCRTAVVRLS